MAVSKMLKGQEIFQSLTFEEVDEVSNFSGIKEYRKDEIVFCGGDLGTHFFVLLEGGVNLRLPADAHEASFVVGRIGIDDIFGLAPLLGAGRHRTTAKCTEFCRILAIEAEPLQALFKRNLMVGHQIMRLVARAYFTRYVGTLSRLQKVVNEIAVS